MTIQEESKEQIIAEIEKAAQKISAERQVFYELKSYRKPSINIKKFIKALHAFSCDLPVKNVKWQDALNGPVFKYHYTLNQFDLQNLTTN